uniref:Putative flavin-dependent reductase n=2 Tax=Arthrobacter sp. AK-1 TaxID=415095 RepID=A6YFJ4_9MICC|nr:putative flavin-dependent reductase [Arthrobacter sp. AK-1]
MTNSTTYPRLRGTGKFAVNVLAHNQDAVSNQFARKGTDKWAGIDWSQTEASNPVIADTLMWLDCDIWAEHEAGDHYIVIGRVNEMSPASWHKEEPLLYFKGKYRWPSNLKPKHVTQTCQESIKATDRTGHRTGMPKYCQSPQRMSARANCPIANQ